MALMVLNTPGPLSPCEPLSIDDILSACGHRNFLVRLSIRSWGHVQILAVLNWKDALQMPFWNIHSSPSQYAHKIDMDLLGVVFLNLLETPTFSIMAGPVCVPACVSILFLTTFLPRSFLF